MKPREIEVHIEELVLHGVAPGARWAVADALEKELHGLLAAQGIPAAWQTSPERMEARATHAVGATKPAGAGAQIARAVYGGEASK